MKAVCVLANSKNDSITGTVTFKSINQVVEVQVEIECCDDNTMKPGQHGLHIHEYGDSRNGCTSSGGHYNPLNVDHGDQKCDIKNRHIGDLGNVKCVKDGVKTYIRQVMEDSLIKLDGEHSIIGRTLVLHADADDFGLGGFDDSKITGHAGSRIACGVIGLCN
ncbi:hypothetical protein A3Q56_02696 [Intoshia linei]|uniref:Superoxide dismutase [Cu-Zn] n=1 Tax=Intoshia linei TaxID=1819745 RepID=A0A177B826_9BILA|nr:hypothetical protein A3Q56_02696 [Intoshia linei]